MSTPVPMGAPTLSFTPHCYHAFKAPTFFSESLINRRTHGFLKLRASAADYPLASKIMIRNLPYSVSESGLETKFSSFGQIAEVKIVTDKATKRSKGYAFIQYTSQSDAMLALENMDQKMFDGRLINVELARLQKETSKGYPIASGPPEKKVKPKVLDQEEEVDCWY